MPPIFLMGMFLFVPMHILYYEYIYIFFNVFSIAYYSIK